MEVNRIYNEDNLETCGRMPDGFVDLVVTSPPYDNLRTYNGYSWDFEALAKELFRVVKKGGVVVWVVGDATINGSETGTSFRQALYFKEVGFNLHDTMIFAKDGFRFPFPNRYHQVFEYMFVFSVGCPLTTNLLKDRRNKHTDANGTNLKRELDGSWSRRDGFTPTDFGARYNIWQYGIGKYKTTSDPEAWGQPAVYPEDLAKDHILSWSNEGDLVYDPFMGSGTTAKAAHQLKRNWIGSEISAEYCELANKRLEPYLAQETLF